MSRPFPKERGVPSAGGRRRRLAACVRGAMEALLLALVVLAPWAAGGVDPPWQFLLLAGVAVLLALEAACLLLEGSRSCPACPVTWCLAGLLLLGALQVLPLPPAVLARLSPATARLYERLLPQRPEELPFAAAAAAAPRPPLSVYPQATRRELVRLLAAVAVFVLVRRRLASGQALRRLAWAAVAVGALLALYALAGALAGGNGVSGPVSGPFVNRNHFACYLNLCLGLALGLLLNRSSRCGAAPATNPPTLFRLRRLGILVALAVILGGLALCFSRVGLLALSAGAGVCALLPLYGSRASLRWGAAVLVLGGMLAAAAWLTLNRIEAPVAAAHPERDSQGPGLASWTRAWHSAQDFPLWGTGLGTFPMVEAWQRGIGTDAAGNGLHDESSCLRELVEAGGTGLAVCVAALGLVFGLGCRAVRHHAHGPAGTLVLGALFAFTALVVHSLAGPVVYVPAIALLAATLCAHLCALATRGGQARPTAAPDAETATAADTPHRHGWAPVLGMACCTAFGLILATDAWKGLKIRTLRIAAQRLADADDPASRARQVRYLEAAARLAPADARLRLELAQAYLHWLREEREALAGSGRVLEAAYAIWGCAPLGPPGTVARPGWAPAPFRILAVAAGEQLASQEDDRLRQRYLVPALRAALQARDSCPLWTEPHLRIAELAGQVARAGLQDDSLARVKQLAPNDPGLWYQCGVLELQDRRPEQAWDSWHRSLELSELYLPGILTRSAECLDASGLLRHVLPDRPGVLVAAASYLYPLPGTAAERRPFLQRALQALEKQPPPLDAEDLHLQAVLQRSLGHPAQAVAAYRAALAREPRQLDWRFELAEFLQDDGRLEESRQEVLALLDQQPEHDRARELLDELTRALAQQKKFKPSLPNR